MAKAVRNLSMTVNSKTAHLVVSSNLPNEFLESLVYIPSRFRGSFNEAASKLLRQSLTLCSYNTNRSVDNQGAERLNNVDEPSVSICRSFSKSDLFATTITGKKSLSLTPAYSTLVNNRGQRRKSRSKSLRRIC